MIMMTPDFVETVVFLENENSAEERVEPGEGTAANRISGYYMALGQAGQAAPDFLPIWGHPFSRTYLDSTCIFDVQASCS